MPDGKNQAIGGRIPVPRVSSKGQAQGDIWRPEGPDYPAGEASKKTVCGCCGTAHRSYYDSKRRLIRDLSCGDVRIYLEVEVREGEAGATGMALRQPFLHEAVCLFCGGAVPVHEHPGRGERSSSGLAHRQGFGEAVHAGAASAYRGSCPQGDRDRRDLPKEGAYLSDRGQRSSEASSPLWFGGKDRSEESLDAFYECLGEKKRAGIRLAVMDMWKAFEKSTRKCVPQAAILYDKFHVMRHLGEALDQVRKMEYFRLSGKNRSYIKGQKYTLLSNRENLTLDGRRALKKLLGANKLPEYGVPAERDLRAALELPERGMGAAVLRPLEGIAQIAEACSL